ncbi:MAG: hypothetical protein QOJ93_1597, partial [Actinomycetota bacterium]|nr:hypothetical protein [Actinomycetota bacterium]
ALVVLIAAGLGGRALIRSATTVPHPGPTEGMEANGFHPSAHLEGRDLVLPLQFVNGASIDLVLPPGTNAGHFNFDPEGVVSVQGPHGGSLNVGVTLHGLVNLTRPGAMLRQVLRARGRNVSLYRLEPTGDLPGAGWTESLVLTVGDWDVLVQVGTEGQPEPSKVALQSYADHIGAHQTRSGFPVLDVSAPFRLVTARNAPPAARLTDWTVIPGSPNAAPVPNMVDVIPGSCAGTGPSNAHGLSVSPPTFPAWLANVSGRPSEFILCSPELPVHLDVMGTDAFTHTMATGLGIKAFGSGSGT